MTCFVLYCHTRCRHHKLREHGYHGELAVGSRRVACHGAAISAQVSCDLLLFSNIFMLQCPLVPQAHSKEEAAEFAKLASAVLINVGTLSPEWTDGMRAAATAARELGKPWVLDPVGAGATAFCTQVSTPPTGPHGPHMEPPLCVWRFAVRSAEQRGLQASAANPTH